MADIVAELRASAAPNTHVGDCMIRAAEEIECLREQVLDDAGDLRTWLCQIMGALGSKGGLDQMNDHEIAAAIYRETVARKFAAGEVQKAIGQYLTAQTL